MKRIVPIVFIVVLLFVLAAPTLAGKPSGFKLGDKVEIVGPAYYNPGCVGIVRFLWEANDPSEFDRICSTWVPQSGTGIIKASNNGWKSNGCYRVCTSNGCCWVPIKSLRKTE